MEKFKKILKFSIEQRVDFLWISENSTPINGTNEGESEVNFFGSLSCDEMEQVIATLLPSASRIENGDTKLGLFPVVGLGDLQISVSKGSSLSIGLVINTSSDSAKARIEAKHKQNLFVQGIQKADEGQPIQDSISEDFKVEEAPAPDDASVSVGIPVPPQNIDSNIPKAKEESGSISIDMDYSVEGAPDHDGNNNDVDNDSFKIDMPSAIPNLSIDVADLSVDSDSMNLSMETPVEEKKQIDTSAELDNDAMSISFDQGLNETELLDSGLHINKNAEVNTDADEYSSDNIQ